MKVFIALLALLPLVLADHHEGHDDYVVKTQSDLVSFRQDCAAKLNVPAEKVAEYKEWRFSDDEETKCYILCIFEKFGFFDKTKGFDVHKIHHQLVGAGGTVDHSDETHSKIERCADKNTEGSDPCAWAYRGGMCFLKENLQLVKQSIARR